MVVPVRCGCCTLLLHIIGRWPVGIACDPEASIYGIPVGGRWVMSTISASLSSRAVSRHCAGLGEPGLRTWCQSCRVSAVSLRPAASGLQIGLQSRFSICAVSALRTGMRARALGHGPSAFRPGVARSRHARYERMALPPLIDASPAGALT
jgi:hypothetical protein